MGLAQATVVLAYSEASLRLVVGLSMRGGDFPAYTARVLCSKPCSNWPSAVTAINGTSSTLGSGLGLGAGLGGTVSFTWDVARRAG